MKFRQGFLTLTIPGVTTADHKQVKRLILDKFFTYCRNRLGLTDYVWTAELQKRGEIHFHCIVNTFMDKSKIRKAWIRSCQNSGIVIMSKDSVFPSTEIEKCKSYNGSKVYAAKYLSKALRSGLINGRIWGGSHGVTGPKGVSTNEIDNEFSIDKVLAELAANDHTWHTFDHEVRISKVDTHKVTKRKYPIVWRMLMNQLHDYDKRCSADLRQSQKVDSEWNRSRSRDMEAHRVVPHSPVARIMERNRNRINAKSGELLSADQLGVNAQAIGEQFTLFSGLVERGNRSSEGRRFRYSHDT